MSTAKAHHITTHDTCLREHATDAYAMNNKLRVAVCGSGISGATAARVLAQNGCAVTVFESGFGVGGRASTRQTRAAGQQQQYQFDHGAQYISAPRSTAFAAILGGWRAEGFVDEWRGAWTVFDASSPPALVAAAIDGGGGGGGGSGGGSSSSCEERWVGTPRMGSIARGLLAHDGIETRTSTKARVVAFDAAAAAAGAPGWSLAHAKTGAPLGPAFDWLLSTDRIMSWGRQGSALVKAAGVGAGEGQGLSAFVAPARAVASVTSLVAMVAFTAPLPPALGDGVRFEGHGALAWAARDSSKPGRARSDGRECWVLHSTAAAAKRIAAQAGGGGRRKAGVREVRAEATDVLLREFGEAVLLATGEPLPATAYVVGHRWGAAFPASPWSGGAGSSSSSSASCAAGVSSSSGEAGGGGSESAECFVDAARPCSSLA
jgi:predicted NAD/FAD-dependent oxidoreductase